MTTETKKNTFEQLIDLQRECEARKANKHEQVKALISGCIELGLCKSDPIISTLVRLGYNPKHVGKLLHDNINVLWARDKRHFYTLINKNK